MNDHSIIEWAPGSQCEAGFSCVSEATDMLLIAGLFLGVIIAAVAIVAIVTRDLREEEDGFL